MRRAPPVTPSDAAAEHLKPQLYPQTRLCYNQPFWYAVLTERPKVSVPQLAPNFAQQDTVFLRAFNVLRNAISGHAFPAASTAVASRGRLVALKGFGHFTFDTQSPPVAEDTIFDLASVSKVVATTAMAMILYDRGELDLDTPVANIIPEFAADEPLRHEITLRMLLAHSSGLPAYEKLFEQAQTPEDLLRLVYRVPLTADPGSVAAYSDIGFIILGEALARIGGEALDRFCQSNIFGPLGMARTAFCPPQQIRGSIPPTANDTWFRHRVIQGEVHDENASVLGGVAGHAGLFSCALDIAVFAESMLRGNLVRPETVALFTRRRETNPIGSSRALGWDTPSQPSQSGEYFSPASFGHLGYTGTSLWIDPERQLTVTLLTNRTWPDNRNQSIQQVRPAFHDAIIEALEGR
ncbi:MAG TPA: serine hydrolase domain-containing protein [Terriglobales bacterium]|nr:serine hydrolase domain-containing protein [Terriglobales bacterium]